MTVALVATVTGSVLIGSTGAAAQVPPSDDEAYGDLIGDGAEVGARDNEFQEGSGNPSPSRGNPNISCRFYRVGGVGDGAAGVPLSYGELKAEYDEAVLNGREGVLVYRTCVDLTTGEAITVPGQEAAGEPILWTPSVGNALVDPEVLATIARNRLEFPRPSGDTSPSLDAGTFAQLQTYFWAANWEAPAPSATATAGAVSATVSARPIWQIWTITDTRRNETHSRRCDNQGVRYDAAGGLAPPVSECAWTPPHSSAGQDTTDPETGQACFEAFVTITWDVTWSAEGAPGGGNLGTGESTSRTCIVVQEIQAVVTDG